jgi:hypothetical protein
MVLDGLDLCYAPPFGSANDLVVMAGFVAPMLTAEPARANYSNRMAHGLDMMPNAAYHGLHR